MKSLGRFSIAAAVLFVIVVLSRQAELIGVPQVASQDSDAILQRAPAKAQARKNPYAGDNRAALAGRKLFHRHCAECHGDDGRGGKDAPSLRTDIVRFAQPGALVWFLRNGNLRRGMPSWARLPEARLWQIVTDLQLEDPPKSLQTKEW